MLGNIESGVIKIRVLDYSDVHPSKIAILHELSKVRAVGSSDYRILEEG